MDSLDTIDNCQYFTVSEYNDVCDGLDTIYIFHQNIRSFHRNYDEFSVFIDGLGSDIDVLVFTETWFTNSLTCDIDGFKGFHVTREEGRGGGV